MSSWTFHAFQRIGECVLGAILVLTTRACFRLHVQLAFLANMLQAWEAFHANHAILGRS